MNSIEFNIMKNFFEDMRMECDIYTGIEHNINIIEMRKLEGNEMWCYRNMLEISRCDRITNDKISKRING